MIISFNWTKIMCVSCSDYEIPDDFNKSDDYDKSDTLSENIIQYIHNELNIEDESDGGKTKITCLEINGEMQDDEMD